MKNLLKKSVDSVLIMTIAMAFSICIATVARFILAKQLDAEIFGNFAIATVCIGFAMIFVNTSGDKFIVVTKINREESVNVVFTAEIIVWAASCFAWFVFSFFYFKELSLGMSLGMSSLLLVNGLSYPLSRPRALLERDLNFRFISLVSIVVQLLCASCSILLSYFVKSELPLIIGSLATFFQSIVFFKFGGVKVKFCLNRQIFSEYRKLCLPLMATGLLVYVYWNGDKFLLNKFVSREEVGYYTWAFSLGAMVLALKDVIAGVVFPIFANLLRSGESEKMGAGLILFYRILMLLNGLIVPTLITAAPYIIELVGHSWLGALVCLRVAICIFTVRTLNSFLDPVLVGYSKSKMLMYFAVFNTIAIMLGGLIFLSIDPTIETMAYVILAACLVNFLICAKTINTLCGVDLIKVVFPGLVCSLISGVLMYIMISYLGDNLSTAILIVIFVNILYSILMWRDVCLIFNILRHHAITDRAS